MDSVSTHAISLEQALFSIFGDDVRIVKKSPIGGGDINEAYGLELTNGAYVFMKMNRKENISFFTAEAAGLNAIAEAKAIGTPQILSYGTDEDKGGSSFLLLEYVEGKSRVKNYWEMLGHQLAALHRAPVDDFVIDGKYGFVSDNYIGRTRQVNTPKESWVDFFRECRLKPQFKRAGQYFSTEEMRQIDRLLERLDEFLVEPEQPSLLHGDLWSGNVITGNDGRAWLIDPAVYVGHAEADIAMTELFGGFSRPFYTAYRESGLLQPGYEKRRDLYNLYHLLNHLNMFGMSYLSSVKRIVQEYD